MIRVMAASTFGALLLQGMPCGTAKLGIRPPSVHGAEKVVAAAQKSEAEAKKCEAFKKPVVVEEERAIGGAVAVAWVKRGGGLMLDLPKDVKSAKDPSQLRAVKAKADVNSLTLPKSGPNELNQYLNYVGKNLAALSSRPQLGWTFGVLNDSSFNAFSAPGGYVLVTRGLLANVKNEAELAGVLAHEIGHVTGQHAIKVYNEVRTNQCVAAARAGLVKEVASSTVQGGLHLGQGLDQAIGTLTATLNLEKLSKEAMQKLANELIDKVTSGGYAHDDEYAADRTAVELMVAAGYRPQEYLAILGRIPDAKSFANHPKNSERQNRLVKVLDTLQPQEGAFGYRGALTEYPAVDNSTQLKLVKK